MKKHSNRFEQNNKLFSKKEYYTLREALELLQIYKKTNFDETVDVAFNLGVDTRKSDQQIRGSVILPSGTGKKMRIIAFVKGEDIKKAEDKGVVAAGDSDLINKIEQGWLDFDVAISTPEMMPLVGKIGKILGPRGLMPSPKAGTITKDIEKVIDEINSGKIEFKTDKYGNVHSVIGKLSFGNEKLLDNFLALYDAIIKLKPSSIKGTYLKNISLSSTMSPGIRLKDITNIK